MPYTGVGLCVCLCLLGLVVKVGMLENIKWTKIVLYSKSLFIIKNIIQAFTEYYNKWFYATVNSLYRKWRNISIFFDLCYEPGTAKREEREAKCVGGLKCSVTAWQASLVCPEVQTHTNILLSQSQACESTMPCPRGQKLHISPVIVGTGALQ